MKIAELFRRLSFGQLSNLAIANNGNGQIKTDKHPQIVQYTNEALLRLFSRFMLKTNDLIIEQVQHITNYHLVRKYAESAEAKVRHPYIKDLPDEPFQDDVIRILEVVSVLGEKLPLNDRLNPRSLFTPQPNILQVPQPLHGMGLGVQYQARHPLLSDTEEGLLDQDIDIPFFLESALQYYIGYRTYSDMNGAENVAKSQEYLSTYEAICSEVEAQDLVMQTVHTSHHKLEQRGFV